MQLTERQRADLWNAAMGKRRILAAASASGDKALEMIAPMSQTIVQMAEAIVDLRERVTELETQLAAKG